MKETLSINQRLPCPFAIWAFALDGNLVRSCQIVVGLQRTPEHVPTAIRCANVVGPLNVERQAAPQLARESNLPLCIKYCTIFVGQYMLNI